MPEGKNRVKEEAMSVCSVQCVASSGKVRFFHYVAIFGIFRRSHPNLAERSRYMSFPSVTYYFSPDYRITPNDGGPGQQLERATLQREDRMVKCLKESNQTDRWEADFTFDTHVKCGAEP